MDSIKFWIISLCGAMAVSAIFKLLLSDSKLKRVVNVFFSIFILFYTVIPTKAMLKNSFEYESADIELYYDQYYQNGYVAVIEQSIINTLEEEDIKVLEIEVDAYIDSEGYLTVNEIFLQTDSDNFDAVKKTIKEKLGFEVTIQ